MSVCVCVCVDWAVLMDLLSAPPHVKALLRIVLPFTGLCSPRSVWQPLLTDRNLHVQAALSCERRCATGLLSETVFYTAFYCRVIDTKSIGLGYFWQQLLSLSSGQSDVGHNYVIRLYKFNYCLIFILNFL